MLFSIGKPMSSNLDFFVLRNMVQKIFMLSSNIYYIYLLIYYTCIREQVNKFLQNHKKSYYFELTYFISQHSLLVTRYISPSDFLIFSSRLKSRIVEVLQNLQNLFPSSDFFILENRKKLLKLNPANTVGAVTIRNLFCAILPLQQHSCARVHCLDEIALSSFAQLGQQ